MDKTIEKFLNSCEFGQQVFVDYYGEGNKAGYESDLRTFRVAKSQCRNLIERLGKVTEAEFLKACGEVWQGRLELKGGEIVYTAGQFGIIEEPQALSAVLSQIEGNRKQFCY